MTPASQAEAIIRFKDEAGQVVAEATALDIPAALQHLMDMGTDVLQFGGDVVIDHFIPDSELPF